MSGKATNTPAGDNVTINLGGGITITFRHVNTPGVTTATTSVTPPGVPDGYRITGTTGYFDIRTTAGYKGTWMGQPGIDICVVYDPAVTPNPLVQHYAGAWLGVATYTLQSPPRVCGRVTSLSPFAIPELEAPRIAFTTNRDGNDEIYTMLPDGSDPRRLTNDAGQDNMPAWSADGTKIAFVSDRDGSPDIWVMNADGTNQVPLTNDPSEDHSPAWSPSGTQIAFTSERDGNQHVYIMTSGGANETRLTSLLTPQNSGPSWSPDGTRIAFATNRHAGDWEIYAMDPDGSDEQRLTTSAGVDHYAAWSPDGTRIAFASNRDGDYEIFTMNKDGTNPVQRTTSGTFDTTPAWSADSSQLAFHSDRDGDSEIFTMDADGSNQTNISDISAYDDLPNWSRVTVPGADADRDGCTDQREAGPNAAQGGLRSPVSQWDFMDQFTGGVRNGSVSGGDIGAVVARFGSVGSPSGDPAAPPAATTGYHTGADRNGSYPGQEPWDLRPPDGSVSGGDIGAVVVQFGHSCV
jgi:Tol biopolymer transport system component